MDSCRALFSFKSKCKVTSKLFLRLKFFRFLPFYTLETIKAINKMLELLVPHYKSFNYFKVIKKNLHFIPLLSGSMVALLLRYIETFCTDINLVGVIFSFDFKVMIQSIICGMQYSNSQG